MPRTTCMDSHKTRQTVELRQGTRNNQVVILVNQRSDIARIHIHETGISLVNQYHGIAGDILHDTSNLLAAQAITRGVVGRCQQQHAGVKHAGVNAVGVLNNLVDIIGEGILQLMQGIHLESTATLAGHTIVVPPRELWDENLLVVTLHQEVVNGILQHVLAAIGQQDLFLRHIVDFAQTDTNDTLFALIIDTGIEAEVLGIEIFYRINNFLTGFKIKLVSIEIIHLFFHFFFNFCKIWVQRYEETSEKPN